MPTCQPGLPTPPAPPLLAPPRLVPSPPLATSTLGDQTRARTVAARSRPGSCCNRPLLLETGQAGQAGQPPWASQTLDRSNSGVGAANGDTYDGGGRSCTNINKNQREKSAPRVQIYLPSRSSRSSGSDKWGGLRNFWRLRIQRSVLGIWLSQGSKLRVQIYTCRHVRHVRQAQTSGGGCGIFGGYGSSGLFWGFGSTRAQNSAASPTSRSLTSVTNVTALGATSAALSRVYL